MQAEHDRLVVRVRGALESSGRLDDGVLGLERVPTRVASQLSIAGDAEIRCVPRRCRRELISSTTVGRFTHQNLCLRYGAHLREDQCDPPCMVPSCVDVEFEHTDAMVRWDMARLRFVLVLIVVAAAFVLAVPHRVPPEGTSVDSHQDTTVVAVKNAPAAIGAERVPRPTLPYVPLAMLVGLAAVALHVARRDRLIGRRLRRLHDVGHDWRSLLLGAPPARRNPATGTPRRHADGADNRRTHVCNVHAAALPTRRCIRRPQLPACALRCARRWPTSSSSSAKRSKRLTS